MALTNIHRVYIQLAMSTCLLYAINMNKLNRFSWYLNSESL